MSEAQMDSEAPETTSAEEKFFGVRTQIGKSRDEVSPDSDIELEIVDDRSAEDRRPPKSEALSDDEDDDDGVSNTNAKNIVNTIESFAFIYEQLFLVYLRW